MALTQRKGRSPAKQGVATQRSHAWVGSLVLLLISTVISLVLAEFTFRVVKQLQWHRAVKWHQHELYSMLPDSPLEYVLHPGVSRENLIPETSVTWSYKINSDGFRGGDFDAGNDRRRVLFVGDSYTFGWAVEQEVVISEVVEQTLARPPYRLDIHAINLGVPGYNTLQEYHLLDQVVDRYTPDLVVLGYVMNDGEPQQLVHQRPSVRYKYATSWLFAFIKEQINYYIFQGESILPTGVNLPSAEYLVAVEENGPKWEETRLAFSNMAALCKRKGIPFVVVIYPSYNKPFDHRYPFRIIHQKVTGWAEEQGVPVVDMLPHMEGKDHTKYRVDGDGHPNGLAFEEAAQAISPLIYEYLKESEQEIQN